MASPDDPRVREALSIARQVADDAYHFLSSGTYRADERTRYCAMLAATIADGYQAVVTLSPSHGVAHADTIVRSMIEALGDLYHLVADPRYLDRMKLTSAKKFKTAGEQMIQLHVADDHESEVVRVAKERCRNATQVINSLSGSARKLEMEDRINAPGLPAEVAGIYTQLCFDAHHDLSAIARRHFRGDHIALGEETVTVQHVIGTLGHATTIVAMALDVVPTFAHFDGAVARTSPPNTIASAARLFDMSGDANKSDKE